MMLSIDEIAAQIDILSILSGRRQGRACILIEFRNYVKNSNITSVGQYYREMFLSHVVINQ